jgi:hypothetical protein
LTKLLKYSAFALGIGYGWNKYNSLTHYVKNRNELENKQKYLDLVEEAKIAFDAHKMAELSVLAKADGSIFYITIVKTVDPESIYYNADQLANWAVKKFGV